MRFRLLGAASIIVLVAACGSGDGSGTGLTITATLPSDASIARPTDPPETDAGASPAETQAPETQPEQPPAETQAPETQPEEPPAATAAPDTSTVAPLDDEDSTVWWPWVLAGVVAIGAVAALAGRRRTGPSWQTQTTTMLDEIEQLTSHLAALTPDGLRAVAQSDAMRLATMRAGLRDLIASAPDTNSQTMLNALTTPIAELHGAVDAVAMSVDPSVQAGHASVAQLAAQLHTASASVRAALAVRR